MSVLDLLNADFVHVPYSHQLREFEKHCETKARALAWTMRTGKSKATIDKICHLYKRGKIDAVLCVAPNGVHANWLERECPAHMWPSVPYVGLYWRTSVVSLKGGRGFGKVRREQWEEERDEWLFKIESFKDEKRLTWLSIMTETMTRSDVKKIVARYMRNRRVFIIWDECDDFAVPKSKRTRMARWLADKAEYKQTLSGTMLTGGLLGAFSQFELLEREALGFREFKDFKDYFSEWEIVKTNRRLSNGRRQRGYPKFVRYKNEPELRRRIAKFTSVVTREDADLPPLIYDPIKLEPSPEMLSAYRELHRELWATIGTKRVSIGERTTKFGKLQQIMSGFLIDEFGDTHVLPGENPRLYALSRECFLAPGKTIIWCKFQRDIDAVIAQLLADGRKPVGYHGRMSTAEKSRSLREFNEGDATDLVGHPQAGGRGLNMSIAHVIINYSHTFSARLREQSIDRATQIGGKNIRVVDFIMPGPDPYILDKVQNRIDVADAIAGTGLRDFLKGIKL